jgi:hypothetical protein
MTMGHELRLGRLLVAATVLAAAITPILPLAARGCSCAMPSDLHEWVDQSEAVFVGTLVEKQDIGEPGPLGIESIYVFQVEDWIKGDAGHVIEVHSPSDGSSCGFEFWNPEQRIGAAIRLEGGVLRSDLCSQIDADVALTLKHGMVASKTGIPRILAANGWDSTRLTLLDASGGHITDIAPPPGGSEFDGTQLLETCPGGSRFVQVTTSELIVWDAATLEPVATHELGLTDFWGSDVSCRDEDASSIWLLQGSDTGSRLSRIEDGVVSSDPLPGTGGWIGTDYVLSQSGPEGDLTWIDVATGAETVVATVPPGELWSISAAPHPEERRVALVETRFADDGTVSASLSIVSDEERLSAVDLALETYSPVWLDDGRVMVTGYNWEESEQPKGLVVDLDTDAIIEVSPLSAGYLVADGNLVFGANAGSVFQVDLTTGSVDTLATLPTLNAGPLVILEDAAAAVDPATTTTAPGTGSTIPPLVAPGITEAPEAEAAGSLDARWIAGGVVVVFFGLLAWLVIAGPRKPSDSS